MQWDSVLLVQLDNWSADQQAICSLIQLASCLVLGLGGR